MGYLFVFKGGCLTVENKFNEHEDQAAELRKLLDEVERGKNEPGAETIILPDENPDHKREIDILNLPPRGEIHNNKKRTQIKFSFPLIRFLFVIIILGAVLAGLYYVWGNELINLLME